MPYNLGNNTFERSNVLGINSILGDLSISEYVNEWELDVFDETKLIPEQQNFYPIPTYANAKPLKYVVAVDGSNRSVYEDDRKRNGMEAMSFVVLRKEISPVSLTSVNVAAEAERDSSHYQIVLPIKGMHARGKTVFETLASTAFRQMSKAEDILDTYKYFLYKQWDELSATEERNDKIFRCPYCLHDNTARLEYGSDTGVCSNPQCKHEIFVTDFLVGYERRYYNLYDTGLSDEHELVKIAHMYMNDFEVLLVMNEIRKLWQHKDKEKRDSLSEYLFIKDGTLMSSNDAIVRSIVPFIKHVYKSGYPIHLISQEKSGTFYNHIPDLEKNNRLKIGELLIPSDEYIQRVIRGRDEVDDKHTYGHGHNIGAKLYCRFGDRQTLVLNIPIHTDRRSVIKYEDLIGANRILPTIQEHVLNDDRLRYIELANGSVSMADRSTDDLRRFFFDNRQVSYDNV